MAKPDYYENPFTEEMAWDLRQFFARYIALHMMDYYRAEIDDDYPKMLKVLLKWHATIWGKINKNGDADEKFDELLSKVIEKANQHTTVYLGSSKDPVGTHELDDSFLKVKGYLISVMEENQMFGARKEFAGL